MSKLKAAGATGVLVKEQTIKQAGAGNMNSWEEQGAITVFTGAELKLLGMMDGINLDTIIPSHYYIWMSNDDIRGTIRKHLCYKIAEDGEIVINDQKFLDAGPSSNTIFNLGTGYPMHDLEIIAGQGLTISPQIRAWSNVTEEALKYVLEDVGSIPNLGPIYFNDAEIPGSDLPIMKEYARKNVIGIIEFYSEKQKGLYPLIRTASNGGEKYNAIRLHTVTDGETASLNPSQVLDRYMLASMERNMKALLVKMPNTAEPKKDYEDWFGLVEAVKKGLNEEGYKATDYPVPMNIPLSNPIIIWIIGFGPLFLLVLFGRWLDKERWTWILVLGGLMAWTVLLKIQPNLARQAMALGAAILYPTWAVITCISDKDKTWKEAFFTFFKITFISLGGALSIIGLLSQTSYILALDMFRGVKVAHVIPLILVPIFIEYKQGALEATRIKKMLLNPVTYLTLLIVGILGIVFIVYITRTGNTGQTSSYEILLRNLLRKILGVRPRTKEFLIGNPLMLMLLYYGYKEKYMPLLLGATIGQISIINTYSHIHTPIFISLIRTFHGIWIGLIGGVILIFIVKSINKLGRRWNLWEV